LKQINLFTEDELTELQKSLFENQYRQFLRTKHLLADIIKIKANKDLKLDMLPLDVVKKYE
jgi:hypothetical protein